MRTAFAAIVLAIGAVMVGGAPAGDKEKKEVKLVGKICCAKCELAETTKCATVIVVKKDKKDIVYYFDAAGHKKHHSAICTEAKEGYVVGTVAEADKKHTVTVKKLEFNK